MAESRPRTPRAKGAAAKKPAAESSPSPPVCGVGFCPICMAVTAMGEVRPELVEHLLFAGRELLLAVRALIDARLEGVDPSVTKLERITIE
jgi:hypothetical protein